MEPERRVKSRANRRVLGASYQQGSERSTGLPVYLVIESTSLCNLECIMCPYPSMGRENEHMAMPLYEKIIAEARGHVEFMWLHLFGEPLLNPNIYRMIDIAEAAVIRVGLSTNATALTERAARLLLDSQLSILVLCLDGATRETYEAIRLGAKFDRVVANIRRFAEMKRGSCSRMKTNLQMIGMDLNAHEQTQFQREWRDAGFDAVFIKGFHVWANQDRQLIQIAALAGAPAPQPAGICHEPWLGMVVLADGTVVPCCNDYSGRNPLGDLKTQSLSEIWNGPQMRKLRRMLADPHSERSGTLCHRCPFPVTDPVDARLGQGSFDPAKEHLGLYCMDSGGTTRLEREVCQYIDIRLEDIDRQVSPGQPVACDVLITNRSAVRLGSLGQHPVDLSYHWLSADGLTTVVFDGLRTQLRPDLPSGNELNYSAKVKAPDQAGRYRLQVCLVQEGVLWMDEAASSCFCDVDVA